MSVVRYWAVFALGVSAGAAAALIYAPQTGEKTRKQLKRRLEDASEYDEQQRTDMGRINIASVMDTQAWFVKNKFSTANLPAERLVDHSYIDYAAQQLGPFVVENKSSTLKGCR